MEGFSWLETSSTPPFSLSCFFIAKNRLGSWHDLNLNSPFPAGSGNHCWFDPPVFCHWMTFVPLSLLSSAISTTCSVRILCIMTPLPCLTNLHLCCHFLFFSHWTILSPALNVALGTSRALFDKLLTRMELPWMVELFTWSNLNNWALLLGSNLAVRRVPYKQRASFPFLSVLIQ